MTFPDTNTITIALVTSIGYVVVWYHGRRNGARRVIEMEKEHKMMWGEYKHMKKIRENGQSQEAT